MTERRAVVPQKKDEDPLARQAISFEREVFTISRELEFLSEDEFEKQTGNYPTRDKRQL